MERLHPYFDGHDKMILAHQGDSVHGPCNTLPAFERAIQCGADALETDVHWTKDGTIVVCHDATVDRTSNGSGEIRDMTIRELKQLDFGYWFTEDGGRTYPFRGKGVTIPTLKELLTDFPHVRVNIDIKPKKPPSLRDFLRVVFECSAEWRVLVASFHHAVLRDFRQMNRHIATSASPVETAAMLASVRLGISITGKPAYQALQVPVSSFGIPIATRRFVEAAHQYGCQVHVWTIDDKVTMRELLRLGVDGIVTNNPCLGVEARQEFLEERTA